MGHISSGSLKEDKSTQQLPMQVMLHKDLQMCFPFDVELYLSQYKQLQGRWAMRPYFKISQSA